MLLLKGTIIHACNGKQLLFVRGTAIADMAYQTTVGWSLLTSGLVTLLLFVLPGDSLWWGAGLLVAGLVVLYVRRDDLSGALSAAS